MTASAVQRQGKFSFPSPLFYASVLFPRPPPASSLVSSTGRCRSQLLRASLLTPQISLASLHSQYNAKNPKNLRPMAAGACSNCTVAISSLWIVFLSSLCRSFNFRLGHQTFVDDVEFFHRSNPALVLNLVSWLGWKGPDQRMNEGESERIFSELVWWRAGYIFSVKKDRGREAETRKVNTLHGYFLTPWYGIRVTHINMDSVNSFCGPKKIQSAVRWKVLIESNGGYTFG